MCSIRCYMLFLYNLSIILMIKMSLFHLSFELSWKIHVLSLYMEHLQGLVLVKFTQRTILNCFFFLKKVNLKFKQTIAPKGWSNCCWCKKGILLILMHNKSAVKWSIFNETTTALKLNATVIRFMFINSSSIWR